MFFRMTFIFFFVVCCSGFAGADTYLKESQTRQTVGALAKVDICYVDGAQAEAKAAIDRVWRRFDEITARMNLFDPKSDVSRVNAAGGSPVRVHEDVARLIRRAKEFRNASGGVFDITVKPLSDLWKKAAKEGRIPTQEEIVAAKILVNSDKIEVSSGDIVRLEDARMAIDLNGAIQGFAADEGAKILKGFGFRNFLVDGGGEIYASGVNCEGKPWRVGIKDPKHPDQLVDVVLLSDRAISTSGDYEHYYEIQGQKWSHIINPMTGYPEKEVSSTSVIAATALEADLLCKPMAILGPARATAMINGMGNGYGAFFLTHREGKEYPGVYYTPGFKKYLAEGKE